MVYVIFGVALIGAIIYVLRQNIEYGVYWGFVGLALFVVGLITKADIIGFPGLFLLFGSYYFVWKKKNEERSSALEEFETYYATTSSSRSSSSASATMPSDAHAQVEKLAQLIYLVYKDAPYAKNDFAKGSLTFSLQDNGRYQILFWYDWDFSPAKSIIEQQTKLSEGFYFQGDDTLHYETNKVDHTDWFINTMTKEYNLDPVIATLQNNCPGLQIINRRIYQTGFIIEFKYR